MWRWPWFWRRYSAPAATAAVAGATQAQVRKNIRRDDTILRAMVLARVLEEQASDLRQVDIVVSEGVVVLAGAVPTKKEKRQLGRLIKQVKGVRGVKNELQVQRDVGVGPLVKQEGM